MENKNIKPLSDGVAHSIALESAKIIFWEYNKNTDLNDYKPEHVASALADLYCQARRSLPHVLGIDSDGSAGTNEN